MADVLVKNVTKVYDHKKNGGVIAVKDLYLECKDRELLAIIGPSGCGKSTTLRMIAGLEEITEGDIIIGKTRVRNAKPRDLNVAMVFENYALYPHLNAYDNICLNLKVKGVNKAEIEKKVREASKILEIDDILGMQIHQLSSGQKQRVSLGRAIVKNPDVFLVDEPISHVDVRVRINVRFELKKLFKSMGATAIYVTHSQEDAIALADKIAVMKDGELQQVDTANELYENPENTFVAEFVGQPAINLVKGRFEMIKDVLYFKFSGGVITIPKNKYISLENIKNRGGILGVRPCHLAICHTEENDEMGDIIKGEITNLNYHGDFTLISVKCGDDILLVQSPGFFYGSAGELAALRLELDKISLFDEETGSSLTKKQK